MNLQKTARVVLLAFDNCLLIQVGRDFKGLPLPTSGYSDMKNGLIEFIPDKVVELETTHELSIQIDESKAVLGADGKCFIESLGDGKVIYIESDLVKAIANNTSKYVRIGKTINGTSLPTSGFEDLAGNAYSPIMEVTHESTCSAYITLDLKGIVLSSNGDVFAKATLINN